MAEDTEQKQIDKAVGSAAETAQAVDDVGSVEKASQADDAGAPVVTDAPTQDISTQPEEGEVGNGPEDVEQPTQQVDEPKVYNWCKVFYDAPYGTQNYYFTHFQTQEKVYEEPSEPYWIWDPMTGNVHECGLQQPTNVFQALGPDQESSKPLSSDPLSEYQGYNPKIHGNYDPNAPYAKFHEEKRTDEEVATLTTSTVLSQHAQYTATGAFNRMTGRFQPNEQSAERHNDYNKSHRQMNAFFDVDAAANAHEGKSLKEERRQIQYSRKEVKAMREARRAKKEKKKREFLMS